MNSNFGISLQILQEELKDLHPVLINPKKATLCTLQYFSVYDASISMEDSCLYLITNENIKSAVSKLPHGNFIFQGNLESNSILAYTSILSFPANVSLPHLLARISDTFFRYQSWFSDLREAIYTGKPLEYFGKISLPFVRLPIVLFKYNFFVLFSVYDEKYGALPAEHCSYDIESYLSEGIMEDINYSNALQEALACTTPYHFTTKTGKKALCYNIRKDGLHIATLQFDQTDREFTDKDFSLIQILGNAMLYAITENSLVNFSLNTDLQKILFRLLNLETIKPSQLQKALETINWYAKDMIFCIVCCPDNKYTPENALFLTAEIVSQLFPFSIYVIYHQQIVLICNHRFIKEQDYLNTFKKLKAKMKELHFHAGISNHYNAFEKAGYAYQAACDAIEFGQSHTGSAPVFFYRDFLLEKCKKLLMTNSIENTFIPSELLFLKKYDEEHDGDYCKILYTLLCNNMNCTETARVLFMHRNTILNRYTRMKESFGMELHDADYRLKLMIAFLVLNETKF